MAAERVFPAAPVTIGRGLVASSFQFYTTGDESLLITVVNRAAPLDVTVGWRFWREADRSIQIGSTTFPVQGAGTTTTKEIALTAGAIVTLRIGLTSAAVKYGQLWARVQLVTGAGATALVVGTLLQGYLSAQNDLGWPGSPLEKMPDAKGVIVDGAWSNLGVSAEQTVPSQCRWRIIAGHVTATTSALVGDRAMVVFALKSTGAVYYAGTGPPGHPAGTAIGYSIGAGQSPSSIVAAGTAHLPWPSDIELSAGDKIQVFLSNNMFGDFLTVDSLLVREWLDL